MELVVETPLTLETDFYSTRQFRVLVSNCRLRALAGGRKFGPLCGQLSKITGSAFRHHFRECGFGRREKHTLGIIAAAKFNELLDVVDLLGHRECRLWRRRLVGRRRGIVRGSRNSDNSQLSGRAECGLKVGGWWTVLGS